MNFYFFKGGLSRLNQFFQWALHTAAFSVWLKRRVCIYTYQWKRLSSLPKIKWVLHWQLFPCITGVRKSVTCSINNVIFSSTSLLFPSILIFSNLRMLIFQKKTWVANFGFHVSTHLPKADLNSLLPWLLLKSISLSVVFKRNKVNQIFDFNPFHIWKNTESYFFWIVQLQTLKDNNF